MGQDAATEDQIRILRCDVCRTLEEIPDFDGPADYDVLLQVALDRHRTGGQSHVGRLINVPKRAWEMPSLRKALIQQIRDGSSSGLANFQSDFYELHDTFREDALLCYDQHLRPEGACADWHADNKRLIPNTKSERKEAGLDPKRMPVIFLCSFCPVRMYYERKHNEEKMK